MDRRHRLSRSSDFRRVRRQGKTYAHPLVVLIACPSPVVPTRVAFAAGKNIGGAVARNRAKRRLRAAVQTQWSLISPGWDLLLIARPALVQARWPEILKALVTLLGRSEVLRQGRDERGGSDAA